MQQKFGTGDEFRTRVRAWLTDAMRDIEPGTEDDREVKREWDRRLSAAGLAGLTWPQEHGGQGLSVVEEYIFHEECARVGAPEGLGRIGKIMVGPLLIKHGTDEQRARYLPGILSGQEVWCQGFSEPGAGSDLASVRTKAVMSDGGYEVSGHKIWTSFADDAQYCLLLAKTSAEQPKHRNMGMFLLPLDQEGVTVSPIRRITGDSTFSEVFFDGARVNAEDRVGAEDDGWKMAMSVLTDERGPVEASLRYSHMSRTLSVAETCCAPEGANDARLRRMRAQVETVRWHALRVLDGLSAGAPDHGAAVTAKELWSHTWQDLAKLGMDVSCARHVDFWRRDYLESRAATIFSGSEQIQRTIIGERYLKLPR